MNKIDEALLDVQQKAERKAATQDDIQWIKEELSNDIQINVFSN
ncbi:hypothetical protein [Domibacillus sp. A3M-37]|nr:hypothetical protein [Domibacillus sp. A3M-37]